MRRLSFPNNVRMQCWWGCSANLVAQVVSCRIGLKFKLLRKDLATTFVLQKRTAAFALQPE